MSVREPARPAAGTDARDAAMTAHRREDKYLANAEQAKQVAAAADHRLVSHRFRGDGANTLPGARHFVSTIYFDTPGRELYRAAQRSDRHLKLRAKEYYDLHPALTETATSAAQLVRFQPIVWLEVKHRDASFTGKQRVGIPKIDVSAFFAEGRLTAEMVAIQEAAYGANARTALTAVADLCAGCAEPLRADCLVNYRRAAWQDDDGSVRLTIDTGLAFYAPPPDLWSRSTALVRESLGPAVAHEARRVIEVKTRGPAPRWMAELCTELALEPVAFSKFDAAATAVHGGAA